MFLGIEIGGTKLQLGVGLGLEQGEAPSLIELQRFDVQPTSGAEGIRAQILKAAKDLIARHRCQAIGIGFGGPLDTKTGRIFKSHQIQGWDDFPLVAWCEEHFQLPTGIQNDADTAGLAEAIYGAGRQANNVFYVTVGSGIGGGLILNKQIYAGSGKGAAEIGHLRPGLAATDSHYTVESLASGWGIANTARTQLEGKVSPDFSLRIISEVDRTDLEQRCENNLSQLTGKMIADAANENNIFAESILQQAFHTLGWAIAQTITLTAPEVIVIGGGVSLLGEDRFFVPVRKAIEQYVFPPYRDTYHVVPAQLGEEVVVHGAIAVAKQRLNR